MKKSIISTEIGSAAKRVGEEKAVELIGKAGFDAWDFSMFRNLVVYDGGLKSYVAADHPLAGANYLAFARKLRRIGEDYGMHCNQSHAPFPTAQKAVRDCFKRALELTAEAGGKICIIHPDNNKTPEENAEIYFEILPFAKSVGVKMATENMWNWSRELDQAAPAACSRHDDFLRHIKAVNDEYFVACLDIGHAEMRGLNTSAVQMIETLGDALQALHVHDNNKHKDNHSLPFTMDIDFVPIIKSLKKIGYKGDFTMESDAWLVSQENLEQGLKKMAETARRLADWFDDVC